ncbi:MAG: YibE/F family protein [Lactococcus sp.]
MNSLLILFILLSVLMIAIAKKDGIRNLLGLAFNFITIFLLVNLMGWGFPVLIILPVFTVIILALSIYMSSEDGDTTNIAFKTSIIVVLCLMVVAVFLQYFGQFQGFSSENADELENLSLTVGLNFSNVVIAVMTISMLGAVAESAMAIVANLTEVIEQDPEMTLTQFHQQRKVLSQQILGTAINTLFFGMLGATVGLILWFVRLQYSWAQILNSKLLMAEVASMLLGMFGILFAIVLAAAFVEKDFRKKVEHEK